MTFLVAVGAVLNTKSTYGSKQANQAGQARQAGQASQAGQARQQGQPEQNKQANSFLSQVHVYFHSENKIFVTSCTQPPP